MRESRQGAEHIWPGFVDALSALLTVVLFAFLIFVVSYVYLYGIMQKKDSSLETVQGKIRLLEGKVAQGKREVALHLAEAEKLRGLYQRVQALVKEREAALSEVQRLHLEKEEGMEKGIHKVQEDLLRKEKTLALLEKQWKELIEKKSALGAKSEFFGKLKKALGQRKDVRVVGDRFVFQSEVLFDVGASGINGKGKKELAVFAQALTEVMDVIPADVAWVLRVDGHTDNLPIRPGGKFASNLALSTARSIAVVQFLISQGVPEHRLAAAGFGEFRPLTPGHHTPKDRRIELMLDQGY